VAEGTTSNGQQLIYFHKGAFVSGTTCLPVVIKYSWRHFSPAWESFFFVPHLLQTLCQLYNSVEVQFLPVFTPSDEQRADPALYAAAVRKEMSLASNIPIVDATFKDKMQYHGWQYRQNGRNPTDTFCQKIRYFWCNPSWKVKPGESYSSTQHTNESEVLLAECV
jgi:lysophosphatidylcholine acyltransferase/lyso-PAF acetyltransferase